jgi:outer membrane protein OmpA-like peptidoglycan-associated protein
MSSRSDDEALGLVLGLVLAVLALVIALVLAVALQHRDAPVPPATAGGAGLPAPAAPVPVVPVPAVPSAQAQAQADAASITVEYGVVKFYFASGKADLAPGAGEALVDVVRAARAGKKVVIAGFHDVSGQAAVNAELARRRALAVRDALKAAGVADSQITLQKTAQRAGSGSDAEARRVEITLQ